MSDQTGTDNHVKRRKLMLKLAIVFVVLALVFGLYWLLIGRFNISTDNAYVAGNAIIVSAEVKGTVDSIFVDDTQFVREGDVLGKLNDFDFKNTLQKAQAHLIVVYKQIQQAVIAVEEAKALLRVKKLALEKTKNDVERRRGLIQNQAISGEESQHISLSYQRAEAEYKQAQQKLLSAETAVVGFSVENHPLLEQAKTAYLDAYLNWKRTIIRAPSYGIISKRSMQVGQTVRAGMPLLMVVPFDQMWLEANFKETQLERLRIGQKVNVEVDAYPHAYQGVVQGLGTGTGSAFALLPAQNATGNWVKVVQRLPVRIALKQKELRQQPLQIGLSAYVTVYTRGLEGKRISTAKKPSKIQYFTKVHERDEQEARQSLQKILSALAIPVGLEKGVLKKDV